MENFSIIPMYFNTSVPNKKTEIAKNWYVVEKNLLKIWIQHTKTHKKQLEF